MVSGSTLTQLSGHISGLQSGALPYSFELRPHKAMWTCPESNRGVKKVCTQILRAYSLFPISVRAQPARRIPETQPP